jgi:hypothetical protein
LSQEADRIKRFVEFKKKLEHRIEKLSSSLKDSQAMLEIVNSIILEKGFRRLEVSGEPTATQTPIPVDKQDEEEPEPVPSESEAALDTVPLKTSTGELLATLYVNGNSLRVILAEDKRFDINTPPFNHFLVERILLKMQERDSELVHAGQLAAEDVLCYSIVREGDAIREIIIKNTDPDRLKELKSSIRWTLEKMYEKTRDQG